MQKGLGSIPLRLSFLLVYLLSFSQSLISLLVSVDVKHHVYLLII